MKKLCKWAKEGKIGRNEEFLERVRNPRYVCDTCGRAANRKKALCDPLAL